MKKKHCLFYRIYLAALLFIHFAGTDSTVIKEYAVYWKTIMSSATQYQHVAIIAIQRTLSFTL
ncbi:MAG TPA: hypothetical protein PKV73_11825 [Agriterribacter sp.]|nr:hypothetical protein [Agriterribacter sp.]